MKKSIFIDQKTVDVQDTGKFLAITFGQFYNSIDISKYFITPVNFLSGQKDAVVTSGNTLSDTLFNFAVKTKKTLGDESSHWQAFYRMRDFYIRTMNTIRSKVGAVNALDFGTGRYGVGRSLIEPKLQKGEHIALYDPYTPISHPIRPELAHVVTDKHEVFAPSASRINLVNLSYVLCFMETADAQDILYRLSRAHPNAKFLIVEYVLRGREDLVTLLDASAEKKWRKKMGKDEFNRTHCRFDEESLQDLLYMSGFARPSATLTLDDLGMRKALLAEPDPSLAF